jgi:carboxypeptidase Q
MAYEQHAAVVLSAGYGDGGTVYVTSATPAPAAEGRSDSTGDGCIPPWSVNQPPVIPQAVVAAEQYNRIVRLISAGVPVSLEVNIGARFYDDDLMSYNVIADLPGADWKDQVVIVGGCIDSWHAGTGATDNAAGAAVCIEAMRILKELGLKPRRTIRLGLWSGEEQGRLGSKAYAARRSEHEKVWADFDLDDGTGKIRGIYLQGHEPARAIFRKWLVPLKDLGASTLTIAGFDLADNYSFEEVGVPGFFFLRDEIEYGRYAHTNMDVYDRIQEDDLKQAAAVVAWIVYNASICDERIS